MESSCSLNQQYSPAPTVERGKSCHIGGDPKNGTRIVYTSGQIVALRNVANPVDVFIYYEHRHPTLCAKMTPSGFYVASADASNKILIWDTVGEDHVTKLEKATVGKICDMSWTEDSKRIVVVGQGSAKHGEAFMIDTGASVGEIGNHMKPILSCDIKQSRPYRCVTGAEDMHVNYYEGPPFKFKQFSDKHARFVTCVRFSPNGESYVSVGTDKKICVFDGKTGEFKKEIADAHGGGIYSCSWCSDNKRLLTASADKTCKIWDIDAGTCTFTFKFGEALEDQQLGCLWQGNQLLSINLNGDISYLTPDIERPTKVVMGHNKAIEALTYNAKNDHFYTADREGRIIGWDRLTASNVAFAGAVHKTKVCGLAVGGNNHLYSISLDDTFKYIDLGSQETRVALPTGIPLPSQPVAICAAANYAFIACRDVIVVVRDGQIINKTPAAWGPASIAVSSNASQVAVGGNDKKLHVFNNSNGTLSEDYANTFDGTVSSCAFSPNGKHVAGGDTDRQIKVFERTNKVSGSAWGMGARVDHVHFDPSGEYVFTGGLDSCFMIWSLSKNAKVHEQRNAHMGGIKGAQFVDGNTLLTTGSDLVTKSWNLNLR